MESVEKFPIQRITKDDKRDAEDLVTTEFPLTIILNNRELVTLLCSPSELDFLAIGFLSSEGLLKGKDDIKKVLVDDVRRVVRVEIREEKDLADDIFFKRFITSGCGRGASFYSAADVQQAKVESKITVSAAEIFSMVKEFQHRSLTYRATGGVHSAALCDSKGILLFSEDIGRHNAVDKIFGRCIMQGMPTDNQIILTSGRISSEILFKVAKRNIPVLVSISAPTNLGVKLAADLGITLIGFVRGEKMNAYANSWRITVGK